MKYGDKHYKLLHVGSALTEKRFGTEYLLDSIGDNISLKNKSFCELTGLYWVWKNADDTIVGLEHYRRYLADNKRGTSPLAYDDIVKILEKKDVILPKITKIPSTVRYAYSLMHHEKDLELLRKVICNLYPDYVKDYDDVLNGRELYICNIMICKKELMDEYCQWLFDILFELEKMIDISDYDDRQKRIFGFLSERLLNVWIRHNHLKIYECKMINTEQKFYTKFTSKLYYIARYIFNIDILQFQVNHKIKFYHNQ